MRDDFFRHNRSDPIQPTPREPFELLGRSPTFLAEIAKLPLVCRCGAPVLITGPTGTGKEMVARTLHTMGGRGENPFIPVDCGAIPLDLIESELFGHEKGAFTGAVARNIGLIAAAERGTLFLDEVDALPLPAQAKLLRFLQQKEYRPVGATVIRRADVRIISATNRDLKKDVRDGAVREDLFYRLAVIQIKLPALKERAEDIEMLAEHFLLKYSRLFGRTTIEGFSPRVVQRLLMHDWPGNIRELENVIQAAVALCDGAKIETDHLPILAADPELPASFRQAKAQVVTRFEREYVLRLLRLTGGNISQAARTAKKHRRAFWELIRKHRIQPGEYSRSEPILADSPVTQASMCRRTYFTGA